MDKNLRKLFGTKNPYHYQQNREFFFHGMKAVCRDFYENSNSYREICTLNDFDPEQLKSEEDLYRIPVIPTSYFKRNDISLEHSSFVEVTSSGTSGKVSKISYSPGEILLLAKMAIRLGKIHRLFSLKPTHYIMLGYQPVRENKTVISKTAALSSLYALPVSRKYALTYKNGKYQLDLDGLRKRTMTLAQKKTAVRIIGFPSYLFFLLEKMQEANLSCRLPKGSKILLGGGWKQYSQQEISKEKLYALAEQTLGIGQEQIHEFFGAAEHPVLYCTCKNHHFHIPSYARVIIRDVRTLEPLEKGKTGLINLMTPVHSSIPIMSIMTDDLGCIHSHEECGCGIESDYLEILGRVGVQDVKTCSAGAKDILEGGI